MVGELVIPQGIALTRGLKENVFMTVVCSLSSTPLMIVGPPGSSKVCLCHNVLFYTPAFQFLGYAHVLISMFSEDSFCKYCIR